MAGAGLPLVRVTVHVPTRGLAACPPPEELVGSRRCAQGLQTRRTGCSWAHPGHARGEGRFSRLLDPTPGPRAHLMQAPTGWAPRIWLCFSCRARPLCAWAAPELGFPTRLLPCPCLGRSSLSSTAVQPYGLAPATAFLSLRLTGAPCAFRPLRCSGGLAAPRSVGNSSSCHRVARLRALKPPQSCPRLFLSPGLAWWSGDLLPRCEDLPRRAHHHSLPPWVTLWTRRGSGDLF